MRKTALLGENIIHSPSAAIHNFLFNKYNIAGQYHIINTSTDQLRDTVHYLMDREYVGFNVTCPYKEDIFSLLDEVDDVAQKIGAVNTVVINDDKLIGYNTDWYGFLRGIESCKLPFEKVTALVLGAGGAARAVLYALNSQNTHKIYLCNRTFLKAELLSSQFKNIHPIVWDEREQVISECDLIINATTLSGNFINLQGLSKGAVVNDLIYLPTVLQKNAGVINGFNMLLWQADFAFRIWFKNNSFFFDIIK